MEKQMDEIQQGNVVYVKELGKDCVHFICEYCEKEIYKPVVYIRDPNVILLGLKNNLVLNLHHECRSGLLSFTEVMFKCKEVN
jgi:hypothetical protein